LKTYKTLWSTETGELLEQVKYYEIPRNLALKLVDSKPFYEELIAYYPLIRGES
jgi:hypothetical protein